MDVHKTPYLKSLSNRGHIKGSTLTSKATNKPLCHFFGGLRYALAPSERWRRAHKLPELYSYGTRENPGQHEGLSSVCPQPGFLGPADESLWSEDCFHCNIWVPVEEPPKGGWPVLNRWSWLQFGTPNTFYSASLLGESSFKAVVIKPAYRVNLFGFLYSSELEEDAASAGETVGNHGFWDQRLALEWIKENVHLFGGNPKKITISGYSAGAYSVFHQLSHDLRQPPSKSIISQACIWSNGPGVQPKQPQETQIQFNQLLSALNIPLSLSAREKISRLRSIPAKTLLNAVNTIQIHQFRPTTDGAFISPTLLKSLDDGSFARALKARNIRIILGECKDEHFLYSIWYPPTSDTRDALYSRLLADYPKSSVDALMSIYTPTSSLPAGYKNWTDLFGKIYANMQVHTLQRGLVHSLASAGAEHLLYRYRIEFRAKCADELLRPEWEVTHTADVPLWFYGNRSTLTEDEKGIAARAIVEPFTRFVNGEENGC
ncbi:Carboxylesterase [Aspergillus sclerotialis]|uniref:Carboxylic ester hydrolase n=1 Tax=Aspergillus sclerotialis TaxID=2070753 RepID=A0A3A2ZHX7_9EURO|nr:Carboxylesterase [Aspergillus sclerotialis]